MRISKNILHTLDNDIINIWRLHGWYVTEISCPRNKGKEKWLITAELIREQKND